MMSGPRVDLAKFKSGWLLTHGGRVGHFYRRTFGEFRSKCGRLFNPTMRDRSGFVALDLGDFPRCKQCTDREPR